MREQRAKGLAAAMSRCDRRFYSVDSRVLAKRLLGCVLVRVMADGQRLAGEIIETEAYVGPEDKASHARGGRRTARTEPMFAAGGVSYVYFTYGMHWCFNVSSGPADVPQAVLVRALRPVEGLERMRLHRAGGDAAKAGAMKERDICRGPARLTRALAIDRELNALDMTTDTRLFIERPARARHLTLGNSARIGVDRSEEWRDAPLRWYVEGSAYVSGTG